jgi:hypothetical protein
MQSKISTAIVGGLGNKLFQMAHTFGMAAKHGYEPVLHRGEISRSHHETARWDHFARNLPKVTFTFKRIVEPFEEACFYRDYTDRLPARSENVLFNGFFQSEKYFEHCKDLIHEQFRCPDEIRKIILMKHAGLEQGVFVHIRRGDYVNNKFHELNLVEYFKRAFSHYPEETKWFVFSDDLPFCFSYGVLRELKNKVFVNEPNEVLALWTMSLCGKGGVCMNSSFAWWAGWLCKQSYGENALIVYPDRQFASNEVNFKDIVPDCFLKERVN